MQRRKRFFIVLLVTTLVFLTGIVPIVAAPHADVVHVVQPGETLYSIARRYGVNVWTIVYTNGIVNPNYIYVGQRLVIPTGQSSSPPSSGNIVHVVQPGETLTRIALRYGVSVWAVANANGIANINHIYVGQRLTIPGTTPLPQPQPQPQPITFPGPWSGEYFDNVSLSGSAYATREDGSINFNWGYGPAAGGMPVNYFSVRWSGTFHFAEGDYRFYAKVDDGVRVYVDDQLIINGWRDGGFRLYSANRTLTAGDHTVKIEYYDSIQVSRVCAWWKQLSGPTPTPGPTSTPGPTPTTAAPAPSGEWLAEFYNNEDLTGESVATRYDPWIGFEWGTSGPMVGVWPDGFSVRWTKKVHLKTDHYRFCAMSDDGARIWVGDTLVLDEWHANGGIAYCGDYWASTGDYDVKVEYYEHGGDALIYVWWEPH